MNNKCDHLFRFNDKIKDRCEKCMISRQEYLVDILSEKRTHFPHIHVYDKHNTCIAGKIGNNNKIIICNKKIVN